MPRLKRLYEDAESHYKALLAVDVMPHEYTATMVPKLLEKLAIDVRIKLSVTKDENEDQKIDELVEELMKTVKSREKSGAQLKENFGEIKRLKEKRNYNSDTSGKGLVTGATLVANDASKKIICALCLGKQVFRSITNVLVACRRGIGLRDAGEQNCAANAREGSIMNRYVMETMRKREHLKCVVL